MLASDIALSRDGDDLLVTIVDTAESVRLIWYFLDDGSGVPREPIQQFRFADATVWDPGTIRRVANGGSVIDSPPVLATLLPDMVVSEGAALNFSVPATAFTDPDPGEVLTYSASLANGNALPAWLSFNPATRSFTGTAGSAASGPTGIRVTATDGSGLSASDVFDLIVNVQNLTLVGTSGNNTLTGFSGNDTLSGLGGNDTLDGGTGNDTMRGGAGDDTYVVNSTADVVTELAGEGTDTVRSSVTLTLAANVENLVITGASNINGTGNALDNALTGNAGRDTLDGGAGTDVLIGGTGNDTYRLGLGYGADTVQENDATAGNTDALSFGAGIAAEQVWLRHSGNNLEVSLIGTGDKATLSNWYLGSQYHVEQFQTADGRMLLDSQVQGLVDAMAAFAPPAPGQTTLPANYQASLQPLIAANWT